MAGGTNRVHLRHGEQREQDDVDDDRFAEWRRQTVVDCPRHDEVADKTDRIQTRPCEYQVARGAVADDEKAFHAFITFYPSY
jgi:hypothetical protein